MPPRTVGEIERDNRILSNLREIREGQKEMIKLLKEILEALKKDNS